LFITEKYFLQEDSQDLFCSVEKLDSVAPSGLKKEEKSFFPGAYATRLLYFVTPSGSEKQRFLQSRFVFITGTDILSFPNEMQIFSGSFSDFT
jgi:hypothetical protein